MVQFKPYFTGQANPPNRRLTSVQKCFRTTDIESVGDTSHLTFFEMLGNFSIGDYFKSEMILWAQEFLTQVLGLQPERLWPAVFEDDDEAFELWRQQRYPAARIMRYGEDDNYWFSGEMGPCGPDSEVHYDFGEQFGCGPSCHPAHGHARFVEIWNLVFMTYYCDGVQRTPLPSRNIDTGAGLERLASVLLYESHEWDKSRVASVYDTDLFQPVIRRIEQLSGKRYGADPATDPAIRIVAEHSRAVTCLIGDERTPVTPSNEERGYVVRRMLRRAIYFGRRRLGINEPFLAAMADAVIDTMKASYPELERQRRFIEQIITPEELRFDETLSRGLEMLEQILSSGRPEITGEQAFLLHDTYGFPVELTREIAAERGLTLDEAGFQAEMERQRALARAAAGGGTAVAAEAVYAGLASEATDFLGYESLGAEAKVVALVAPSDSLRPIDTAPAGADVEILLDRTPFYPEGGGQVGDRGEISGPSGRVSVNDTQRVAERLILHRGTVVEGQIAVGDEIAASVDRQHRADTMRNHTATHLLHAVLRKVLGIHVRQAGSLVGPDRLRFDFRHTEPVAPEQLAEVEMLVNAKVRENIEVHTRTTSFEKAMQEGVLAFFGEKYGADVRVVEVNTSRPPFSAELCGGTHCTRTGDIGLVLITNESSIGSGMRRIEALSGRGAEAHVRRQQALFSEVARRLSAQPESVLSKLEGLINEQDSLRKRVLKLERSLASSPAAGQLMDRAISVDGVRVLATRVEAPSADALRYLGDSIRKDLGSGVAVLASAIDGRPQFVAIVSSDLTSRGLHAGNLLKLVASVAGGGGGGRPEMAQGGGTDASKIDEALSAVGPAVQEMLEAAGKQ